MDKQASSSHSHSKTSTNAISTKKGPSAVSAEHALQAWVEDNTEVLLKAMTDWTRARVDIAMCTRNVTRYYVNQHSDKDLHPTLGLIYKYHGPLDLRYEGCDSLAQHWISGWDKNVKPDAVRQMMLCVIMDEILPGQLPVLERLGRGRQAGSDENSGEENDQESVDSYEEKNEETKRDILNTYEEYYGDKDHDSPCFSEENNEENDQDSPDSDEEKDQERADWVDVSSGGVDDGDWIRPNDLRSVVKDAGRLLLDGFRKF